MKKLIILTLIITGCAKEEAVIQIDNQREPVVFVDWREQYDGNTYIMDTVFYYYLTTYDIDYCLNASFETIKSEEYFARVGDTSNYTKNKLVMIGKTPCTMEYGFALGINYFAMVDDKIVKTNANEIIEKCNGYTGRIDSFIFYEDSISAILHQGQYEGYGKYTERRTMIKTNQ